MNNKIFNDRKKYYCSSGINTYLDKNIKIQLDKYGFYTENIVDPNVEVSDKVLQSQTGYSDYSESDISSQLFQEVEGIKFNDRIGYYNALYVGHVIEGDYRKQGSSGGLTTWLLVELLKNKEIDGVIHVIKSNSSDKIFEYGISSTVSEVVSNSKTKYYPVELSEVLELISKQEGKYAVVGIPSFISSLRLLCRQDKKIDERIVYMIGLVCGHQKSSKFSDYLAWQVGFPPGSLTDIEYRVKNKNQPANKYSVKITGIKDKKTQTKIIPIVELDAQDWGKGHFKKLSSDFEDDVMNETADVTFGDAWLPEYKDDYKGNNIVVVRNKKIKRIFEEALLNQRIFLECVGTDKIIESQSSHYTHTQDELSYRLKSVKDDNIPKRRMKYRQLSFTRKLIQFIRMKICTTSPTAYEQALINNDISLYQRKFKFWDFIYKNIYRFKHLKKYGVKNILIRKFKYRN